MWYAVNKFSLFKYLLIAYGLLLLIWFYPARSFLHTSSPIFSLEDAVKIVSTFTLCYGFIVYFVGKYLWRCLWGIKFIGGKINRNICPDLNGVWVAKTTSSRLEANGDRAERILRFKIEADFFTIRIKAVSEEGYLHSFSVWSMLEKDGRSGEFWLSYFFEGSVPIPVPTDDSVFDGSAKLKIIFSQDNATEMRGSYWTNRAWQRGLNTAGSIVLTKC